MGDTVLAAVRTAARRTELRDFPKPELGEDSALLKVEVAGICGTDVKMYDSPPFGEPVIMGHENVGIVADAGPAFLARHRLAIGDRVFVEHYVGCYSCAWCRAGQYQHCEATDWRTNPDARRFGYTTSENPGRLWGGFSEYMFLPWNAVLHKVPDGVDTELAGLVTPLANGIEWALVDAGVRFGSTVLIQGPGQQGLSQVVACKRVGARNIIVTGTARDRARLDLAQDLGADHVLDVGDGDPLERIRSLTGGSGVDVVLDCTARAGTAPVLLGIEALTRRGGTLLVQGELAAFPDFPMKKVTEKAITIKSARGHSYASCEHALELLRSDGHRLEPLTTHRFPLSGVDEAIRTLGGETDAEDVIHVSLMPWLGR
ncbi:zinc-dependent alcohol dehydrogenase [Actinophytocola sp.]|uniref:zinc-dependent alcohol dehydrogenase n=1 Tax=Actinophytocola sp. TaxID=1872138 RepID=UPI003D6C2E5D